MFRIRNTNLTLETWESSKVQCHVPMKKMVPLQKDPFQAVRGNLIPSLKLTFFRWKSLVGRWTFFWGGLFSEAFAVSFREGTLIKICSLEPKKSPKLKSGKSTSMTLSFMLIFQRWYSFREGKLCSMVFYEAPRNLPACRRPPDPNQFCYQCILSEDHARDGDPCWGKLGESFWKKCGDQKNPFPPSLKKKCFKF